MLVYKYQYLENLVNDEHVPNDRSRVSYICEKEKYVFDGGVSFINPNTPELWEMLVTRGVVEAATRL